MAWEPSSLQQALDDVDAFSHVSLAVNFLEDLRHRLEASARDAVTSAALPANAGPLRLPKRVMEDLLACERRALANRHTESQLNRELVIGNLIDDLVSHHVLGGTAPDRALQLATHLVAAKACDDEAAAATAAWLEARSQAEREELDQVVSERLESLLKGWPELRPWNPRLGETVSVVLADGDVVISGRIDVALGGDWCERPVVAVEVKSGAAREEHRTDHLLYGLLLALRDGHAPAAVVTCSGADGKVAADLVDEDALERATRRASRALEIAGALASGKTPDENPGWRCGFCADSHRCPSVKR